MGDEVQGYPSFGTHDSHKREDRKIEFANTAEQPLSGRESLQRSNRPSVATPYNKALSSVSPARTAPIAAYNQQQRLHSANRVASE